MPGVPSPRELKPAASAHHHALFAHQAQQMDVRVGLLREPDGVEDGQFGDAGADGGGVVRPQRRAVGSGEFAQQVGGEGVHAGCQRDK